MEEKLLIFVGGPSASGKSTFTELLVPLFDDCIKYRRLDAYRDCAEKKNCLSENYFKNVSSTEADEQFAYMCFQSKCVISDVHYALQANRDFKASDKNNNSYVSTLSDTLIEKILSEGIKIYAIFIECDEKTLFERAQNRYKKNERTMRASSIDDAAIQKEGEYKAWFELVTKHVGIISIVIDSKNNTPTEMRDIFINTFNDIEKAKTKIKQKR